MDLGYSHSSHDRDMRVSAREGELIKYRDMRTVIVFQLTTGEKIEGQIRWYDSMALGVRRLDRSELTLFYHSIGYYEPKKDEA
jgi:sRNA-binding regulator protein Hfq